MQNMYIKFIVPRWESNGFYHCNNNHYTHHLSQDRTIGRLNKRGGRTTLPKNAVCIKGMRRHATTHTNIYTHTSCTRTQYTTQHSHTRIEHIHIIQHTHACPYQHVHNINTYTIDTIQQLHTAHTYTAQDVPRAHSISEIRTRGRVTNTRLCTYC